MFQRIHKILTITEAPFLLIALFASLAWGLTHIVDRALSSPILEYSIKTIHDHNETLKRCDTGGYEKKNWKNIKYVTITNLSSDAFNDIEFALRPPTTSTEKNIGSFAGVKMKFRMPALGENEEFECGLEFATFSKVTLYPDWGVILELATNSTEDPFLHISNLDKKFVLKKSGFETFLIKYEFQIIVGVTILLVMVCIGYLYVLSKNQNLNP